jgi:hypothetical protein
VAKIPGLRWRPIPENSTQPKIRPTQWIVHTFVDSPSADLEDLGDYFERADIRLESHTVLGWAGHDQLLDTTVRGDANYLANRRPDGTGAISTETEDDGTPVERPWNAYQVKELIRTGVELHFLHGIPARLPRTWDDPGMGYHSLYPQHWTNVPGKTCPGSTRIKQFKEVVLPGIRAEIARRNAPKPAPTPEPDTYTEDDDMKIPAFLVQAQGSTQVWLTDNVTKQAVNHPDHVASLICTGVGVPDQATKKPHIWDPDHVKSIRTVV